MTDKEVVFPNKLSKKLPTGFTESVDGMSEEEIKRVIVESEGNIYTLENEKEKDSKLNAAKEVMKELGGGYRDAKATQTAKIKYCLFVLENRGTDLDNNDKQ